MILKILEIRGRPILVTLVILWCTKVVKIFVLFLFCLRELRISLSQVNIFSSNQEFSSYNREYEGRELSVAHKKSTVHKRKYLTRGNKISRTERNSPSSYSHHDYFGFTHSRPLRNTWPENFRLDDITFLQYTAVQLVTNIMRV